MNISSDSVHVAENNLVSRFIFFDAVFRELFDEVFYRLRFVSMLTHRRWGKSCACPRHCDLDYIRYDIGQLNRKAASIISHS